MTVKIETFQKEEILWQLEHPFLDECVNHKIIFYEESAADRWIPVFQFIDKVISKIKERDKKTKTVG